jgi:tetratricopeptide (TPR) repeat protein
MPGLLGLFDILALIYVFRSLQLSVTIWRERQKIKTPPLTRLKKHLAEQAAFFIAVPIGVFVHEFGHAAATWLFGGRVIEFGYRAFWGYVVPQGSFSPTQDWFISLAGTLGSLAFGLSVWLLFRKHSYDSYRYFGLRAFRFQVFFSLIYYPIFTLIGFVGDWRSIYNFGATPLASGVTALSHVGLLLLFWRGDRIGWFEMVGHESIAEQDRFEALAHEVMSSPYDTRLQLRYTDALRRGGAVKKAKHRLHAFIKQHPDSGEGYLQLAAVQSGRRSQIPRQAVRNTERALSLGLPDQEANAFAHQLLGKYQLDLGDGAEALNHFSQAMANIPAGPSHDPYRAQLLHWSSQAHRRLGQFEAAYQDLQKAIALVETAGDEKMAAFFRRELDIIEDHAGRPLGVPPVAPP